MDRGTLRALAQERSMRKLIVVALLCLVGAAAYSQTVCPNAPTTVPAGAVQLKWTPPTTNTDGTPIGTIKAYSVHYGLSADQLTSTRMVTIPVQTACYVHVTGLAPNTYFFALRTVRSDDAVSELSNVVSKTITSTPVSVPNPPSGLTVGNAPAEVFQVLGTTDEFQFLPVGTVPANTQCTAAQNVNGRFVVPTAAVSWYGNVKPKAVVALCN